MKGLLLEDDVYLGTAALAAYEYTVEENIISFEMDNKQYKIEAKDGKMYSNGKEILEETLLGD